MLTGWLQGLLYLNKLEILDPLINTANWLQLGLYFTSKNIVNKNLTGINN